MVRQYLFGPFLIVPVLACGVGESRPSEDLGLAALEGFLTGSFSSRDQSLLDSAFLDVRLRVVRVWPEAPDGPWLYVEQAEATAEDQPYRQRVYNLRAEGDGTFLSAVYALPGDPLAYAGAWRDKHPLEGLSPADLILREGCEVVLRRSEDGAFVGSTEEGTCASSLQGASYATTEVRISKNGFVSWDRGFNEAGEQVWGSTAGGYVFLKQGCEEN